jgi:hypothetical protein
MGDALDLLKVFSVIGGDMKKAAWHKRAVDSGYEFVSHGAPAMVAPFRPRIGEQQVKLRHLSGWDEMLHRVNSVHVQETDVGKFESRRFAAHTADTAEHAFDAEIVVLWVGCRQGDKESAVAATQIDYQWRGTNENLREIQRLRDGCGHEFDRGFTFS